jgi:hypothetical protein
MEHASYYLVSEDSRLKTKSERQDVCLVWRLSLAHQPECFSHAGIMEAAGLVNLKTELWLLVGCGEEDVRC